MRPEAVGLLHGAAEHLPVSSGAHVLALGADHSTAVAAHLGSALACAWLWRAPLRPGLQAAALAPPVLVGGLVPGVAGGSVVAGLVAGSAALLVPARRGRRAGDATWRDGFALGAAQACALWPGVSRLGATAAAARVRGFAADEALALAREVAVPVTLAAVARSAAGLRAPRVTLASAAGAVLAVPLGRLAGRPAPLVAWRLALAAYLRARPASGGSARGQ